MASKRRRVLRWSINRVRGEQDVVDVQVPGAFFTTQGVSPRRDVDYICKVPFIRGDSGGSLLAVTWPGGSHAFPMVNWV